MADRPMVGSAAAQLEAVVVPSTAHSAAVLPAGLGVEQGPGMGKSLLRFIVRFNNPNISVIRNKYVTMLREALGQTNMLHF